MKRLAIAAFAAPALLIATNGCSEVEADDVDTAEATAKAGDGNLSDTLGDIDGLGAASALIEQAGLETMLEGDAPYTLFLPNDEALAALPGADIERLKSEEGRPELIALLRRHIAPGAIAQGDLSAALDGKNGSVELATVAEAPIMVSKDGDAIRLGVGGDAPKLTGAAKSASNGVVYAIDGLIPPSE